MTNLIAYKSNALIEASYKLTLQEQRMLMIFIGKINPKAINPEKKFQITARQFYQTFPDMGIENAERRLQEAVDKLSDRWIQIHWKDKKEDIRWIQQKAKYFTGEGKVELTFSDSIMPYLTQLSQQFTAISVKNISALKRTYSIRIYELLMQFKKTGNRTILLDDFRSMLGLESKYIEFRAMNQLVLKPAIKELNEKSNIIVSVNTVKNGRSVIALDFHFKEDKQAKMVI